MINECRNLVVSLREWLRSAAELEVNEYHDMMVCARMNRLQRSADKNSKRDLDYMPRLRHRQNGKFTIDWSRKLWLGPRGKKKYNWSGLKKDHGKPSYRMSQFMYALADEKELVKVGEAKFTLLRQTAKQLNLVEKEIKALIKILEANNMVEEYPPEKLAALIEESNALLAQNRGELFRGRN